MKSHAVKESLIKINNYKHKRESKVTWLALFTTSGTLVCCAIPITLVTLGMGATVASMVSTFPFLITLSAHKPWVFGISALLLAISGYMMYRPNRACPSDPQLGALCEKSHRWNKIIFCLSLSLWGIGFFAAFLALPIQIWFER